MSFMHYNSQNAFVGQFDIMLKCQVRNHETVSSNFAFGTKPTG